MGSLIRAYSIPTAGFYNLPSVRHYPWPTYCGIPGGIPTRTTIYTSLGVAGQLPTYTQSVTAAQISSAITACPSGQVVYLYPGTYSLSGITFARKSGVTLRGAGPGRTILRHNAGGSLFEQGSYYLTFNRTGQTILSGYGQGSQSITLSSTPNAAFQVGRHIIISETTPYANKWGTNIGVYEGSDCNGMVWWDAGEYKKFAYLSRITSVVGNTISFDSPIPQAFTASQIPTAHYPDNSSFSLCGVEELTMDGAGSSSSYSAARWYDADRCWMKNVEIKNFSGGDNGLVTNYTCFQCEFRRLYVHDCQGFPTQSDGQGIEMAYATSNSMIVDCIVNNVASLYQGAGDNTSCLLYNYAGTMARGTIVQPMGWLNPAISHHGPEPIMGLYEGNVVSGWMHDGYHGSGAWQTIYRNHINGLTPGYSTPYERHLITLCRGSYYINVIGNVLGDSSWTMERVDGTTSSMENCAYGLGFPNASGASTSPNVSWPEYVGALPDPNVAATLIRHGNYDYYNHAVSYISGETTTLYPSMFYPSRPAWYGSMAWPSIGPDVPGYLTDIPAQRRWKNYQVSANLDDLFADV